MSSNFAIVGAGSIGTWIIDELLNYKASGAVNTLRVLSRSETLKSTNPELFAKGVEFIKVEYTDESALADAFKGVDVVLSTVGAPVIDQQVTIGKAAKAAGVKLFAPSEYGSETEANSGIFQAKKNLVEFLKGIDLPYVKLLTGLWIDYCITPTWGWNLDEGKVTIGGSGDAPLSFVHRADLARYIAYVFTRIPPSDLAWKTLRIQSECTTNNKIVADYEAKTGKKLEVTKIPREVLEERANKGDFAATLFYEWDVHGAVVGFPLTNDLYPDWNPKSVIDSIA